VATEIIIPDQYSNDPILHELYVAGDSDGSVSFEQAKDIYLPGAKDSSFQIQSEYDFLKTQERVQRYFVNSDKQAEPNLFSEKEIWEYTVKTSNFHFTAEDIGSDNNIDIGLPKFVRESEIEVTLYDQASHEAYATVFFAADPEDTTIAFCDYTVVDMNHLGYTWAKALLLIAGIANEKLRHPLFTGKAQAFRKTLIDNVGFIHSNLDNRTFKKEEKSKKEDPPFSVEKFVSDSAGKMRSKSDPIEMAEYHSVIRVQGAKFNLYSHHPITEQIETNLVDALSLFPDEIFTVMRNDSREEINILLLSNAEYYEKYMMPENSEAIYFRGDNTIMLKNDDFESGLSLKDSYYLMHELCHMIFDYISSETASKLAYHEVISELLQLNRKLSELLPEHFEDEAMISTAALEFLIAVQLVQKIFFTSPLQCSLFLGLLLVENGLHITTDQEGLLRKELTALFSDAKKSLSFYQASVSGYAFTNVEEFSAETLSAYLITKQLELETGLVSFDKLHGSKTREELIRKHPRVYLAYELYFAPDSPLQYQAQIFYDDDLIEILEQAVLNHNHCGEVDIEQARDELFEEIYNKLI
jgi:hypothetical protein